MASSAFNIKAEVKYRGASMNQSWNFNVFIKFSKKTSLQKCQMRIVRFLLVSQKGV